MQNTFINLSIEKKIFLVKAMSLVLVFILLFFAPAYLSRYYLYLASLILITILFATSLNIPLGYGGLLVLHQATFYGVGAYSFAILLKDFEISIVPAALFSLLSATALALFIGWICVRLRGLYFGFLTLAMGQLVWAIVYRWYDFTGGDDGIHAIPMPDLIRTESGAFYLILAVVILSIVFLYLVVNSSFGLTLQAVRDNPQRCESIGINIRNHRLLAFVIGGGFAGLAGILFVVLERSISPSMMFWTQSVAVLIMVLLGGMFTFFGPAFGAIAVTLMATFFGIFTDFWLLFLGSIKIMLLLFLPQGIIGFVEEKLFGFILKKEIAGRGEENAQRR